MTKYIMAVAFFSFQLVCSMEFQLQPFKKSLSINNEVVETSPLTVKLSERPRVKSGLLSLDRTSEFLGKLPQWHAYSIKKRISPDMSLIHDIATILPGEIRRHIVCLMFGGDDNKTEKFCKMPLDEAFIFLMFDGHQKAFKTFYTLPESEAFQRYYEIKASLGNSDKPIGPLYILSEQGRDSVLKAMSSGYYSRSTITWEEKAIIDHLEKDVRHYVDGKDVTVISQYNCCTPESVCMGICCSCGVPICLGGAVFGVGAACGACGSYGLPGASYVCTPSFFNPVMITFGSLVGILSCGTVCACGCVKKCEGKNVTL